MTTALIGVAWCLMLATFGLLGYLLVHFTGRIDARSGYSHWVVRVAEGYAAWTWNDDNFPVVFRIHPTYPN